MGSRILPASEKHHGDVLPSIYADKLGMTYTNLVSTKHKKEKGQYFTPPEIANLMASFCDVEKKEIKILDAGCGLGILSCSLIEHITKKNIGVSKITLVAYETDSKILPLTFQSLEYLNSWLDKMKIKLEFTIKTNDFVLDNAYALAIGTAKNNYDIIISNPPYFKLAKDDERAIAAKELVSGQPNIYSIFMGIASIMLKPHGELIFITPRSFASGNYFKAFREYFFNSVQIDKIHLFDSRRDTFNRDSVLQETVILKAIREKINPNKKVLLSSSCGIRDISTPKIKYYSSYELIDLTTREKILHLPTSDKEEKVLSLVFSWNNILSDFNISISTGPVVSFRAWDYIINIPDGGCYSGPLFWLHNVNKMLIEFPKEIKGKGQYIKIEKASKSIIIENKDYILLRRFSTKDDKSRLIAAPYFSNFTDSSHIGVENKLNYIYRKKGTLQRNEIIGLCSLLNSEIFDTYFQIFNGNVNVSATELREMKLPPLSQIIELGNRIILSDDYTMVNVNNIVNELFELETISHDYKQN